MFKKMYLEYAKHLALFLKEIKNKLQKNEKYDK